MPVAEPVSVPSRRIGSVRRTSHLDVRRRGGTFPPDQESVTGAARDLVTTRAGVAVIDTAYLDVRLGDLGVITEVSCDPVHRSSLAGLIGTAVGFGFRNSAKGVLAAVGGSLIGALVDDLSGAPAPSGYGAIREVLLSGRSLEGPMEVTNRVDVCAGWRQGGDPIERRASGLPLPFDPDPPVAPHPDRSDVCAWHEMPPLADRSSRRLRRLDAWMDDGVVQVHTMFRDTTSDPDLTVRIVHEYVVTATLHPETFEILTMNAEPGTLPFANDCPHAASSASLLIGVRASEIRSAVRARSRGPVSCTHLNDVFRSLADVPELISHLANGSTGGHE